MSTISIAALSWSPSADRRWRFALVSALGGLLWAVGQAYGLGSTSLLDTVLCHQLAAAAAWALRVLGYGASTDAAEPRLLLLNHQPTVIVGGPCDGLVLYALLVGFVLAYPGSAHRRLWFIPAGIGALWLLNVLRIVALALNHAYSPTTLAFNHHYAFSAVAYALLTGLWMLWARPAEGRPPLPSAAPAGLATTGPPQRGHLAQLYLGVGLLAGLVVIHAWQAAVVAALARQWAWLLAHSPAGIRTLPGLASAALPTGITRLPLVVGATFAGLYLLGSLLGLRAVLPAPACRLVYRSYAGAGLAYGALLALAGSGNYAALYPTARLLLDLLVSPLPVAALLILLWKPVVSRQAQPTSNTPVAVGFHHCPGSPKSAAPSALDETKDGQDNHPTA